MAIRSEESGDGQAISPTCWGLAQPTVSHHLRLLYEAGLVDRERRGTWVYYRIVPERIAALCSALAPAGARRARPVAPPSRRVAADRR